MIDGPKVAKYLTETGLKIQEFWFLYAVMCIEDNIRNGELRIPQTDDNKDFNEYLYHYFTTQSPNIGHDMKWSEVARALEDDDWLQIIQPNDSPLELKYCFTTDKFKEYFLISDIEKAFNEFLRVYPRWTVSNGTKYTTIDMAPEILQELYQTKILKGGNALLHQRCLLITDMFAKDNNNLAPYKISTYLEHKYFGVAFGYENDTDFGGRTSTGRRAG